MTRKFILSLTAALPLLVTAGCGDNGGGTTEGASSSSTGGAASTTDMPTTNPTTEPATTEPATTEPATTEPATTEPATTEPATTTGDTSSTTDVTATTGEPDTSSSGSTGDPLAECLMMVEPDDMCGQCACTNCTMEYETCQADMGCAKIFKCVQDSGCTGQDCALPCGQTIQENGGFMGEPAAKAIALGMCIGNNCMTECGG